MSTRTFQLLVASAVVIPIASACASEPSPDKHPAGTVVTLKLLDSPPNRFTLGPRSSKLFLEMLAKKPVRSNISKMPAKPLGVFNVAGTRYDWHGNAVIHVDKSGERLWHGPYLQRLIRERARAGYRTKGFQNVLDALESDPNLEKTPLDGPGAYPGGGDALNPVRMDGKARPAKQPDPKPVSGEQRK